MPMTLSLMASFSQDCILISLSCLLILFLSKFNYSKKPFLTIVLIFLILFCIILARPPFITLLLVPLTLIRKDDVKFNYNLFTLFIFFLIISIFFILNFPTPNSPGNLEYFFSNPFNFLKIIVFDLFIHLPKYVIQFIGFLGHINITLPIFIYSFFLFVILTLLILYYLNRSIYANYLGSSIVIVAILSSCFFIFLSQYLYFTEKTFRDSFIQGVHGRYFIPLAIILTYTFLELKKKSLIIKIILVTVPHINIFAIKTIYNFFY
jgi:uncharacterized membrane protein